MKIRFLVYRASQERWNIVGHAIALWTAILPCNWGRWKYWYSHVEVWFPDEDAGFEKCYDGIDLLRPAGECFSSTTRGDAEGTRFIPANELLKHPERWDYIECECPRPEFMETVRVWCQAQEGKPYDFKGLFGFFWPWNIDNKNKWYCSELCAYTACLLRLLPLYERISPRRLAAKLAKKYHEPKRLG